MYLPATVVMYIVLCSAGAYCGECVIGETLVLYRDELLWVLGTGLEDMEAADAGDADTLLEVVDPHLLPEPDARMVCANHFLNLVVLGLGKTL